MQPKRRQVAAQNDLVNPRPMRYGWSKFDLWRGDSTVLDAEKSWQEGSQVLPHATNGEPLPNGSIVSPASDHALSDAKAVSISVIKGPSKGLTHQLAKPTISIGQTGGSADMEIDDAQVSRLHCAVDVTDGTVRLYDLDSASGTFVNDERIQAADLDHLSEFRVGSTSLLVMILPKSKTETRD